jgi:adenine-specific DNA-methyltransferase
MRYNKDMVAVKPLPKELPSVYSLCVGNEYVKNKSLTHKKTYGQYYTPLMVSHFMAGLANTEKSEVKIADLGAGSGVLGISVCEVLAKKNPKLRKIDLTAYEIDNELITVLRLALLYTKKWLAKKNIELAIHIVNKDFILLKCCSKSCLALITSCRTRTTSTR